MTVKTKDALLATARQETGLNDFGDLWFSEHIDVLIESLNSQARLSEAGIYGAQTMIVSSLVKRLKHIELIKNHPEILDETLSVKAVLSGLPRTGSTMFHRMLASAPELNSLKWYEAQNYVPLGDESPHDPKPRIEAAKAILNYMLEAIPDLMSIHPMSIEQPDEEVIILGQLFSSSMIESTYFVPDYAQWLSRQNPRPAYEDLINILKSLQWQDKSRAAKNWVLKTPGHLMAMQTVLDVFPDAKIVMTHRDPVKTVPSYCSMMESLYRLGSQKITNPMIGAFWNKRLLDWLDSYMRARESADPNRFIDVNYQDLLGAPVPQALNVLEKIGIKQDAKIKAGMGDWIEANKREHRAPHKYDISHFGLTAAQITSRYSNYISFIQAL